MEPIWRPRGLSKWVISRIISTLTKWSYPSKNTLIITDLLSPRGLQVGSGIKFLNPEP